MASQSSTVVQANLAANWSLDQKSSLTSTSHKTLWLWAEYTIFHVFYQSTFLCWPPHSPNSPGVDSRVFRRTYMGYGRSALRVTKSMWREIWFHVVTLETKRLDESPQAHIPTNYLHLNKCKIILELSHHSTDQVPPTRFSTSNKHPEPRVREESCVTQPDLEQSISSSSATNYYRI